MKQKLVFFTISLLFAFLLVSCGEQYSGPQVWIDQPLEADNPFPQDSLTIQAHASDLDGVSKMIFSVDDEVVSSFNLDGNRMEESIYEWNPPGPGKYLVSIAAEDIGRNPGVPAQVEIIILGEEQAREEPETQTVEDQEVQEEEEEQVVEPEEVEAEEEASEEVSPEPGPPIAIAIKNVNCRLGPGTLFEAVLILLKGHELPIVGESTDQYWWILQPEGASPCWIAKDFVDTDGSTEAVAKVEPPPPPPPPEQEPPPPEEDTTDPEILSVVASPDPIYHEVCGSSFDLVVHLTVNASDDVAIDHVGGTWAIGGDSGDYILDHSGGTKYQKDFGPFTSLGPLYFVGSAEDTSGNWTYYEAWVTIKNCIE